MRSQLADFLHHIKRSSTCKLSTLTSRDLQQSLVLSQTPRLGGTATVAWSEIGIWRLEIQSRYTTGLGSINPKYSFKTTRSSQRSRRGVPPRGIPNERVLQSNRNRSFTMMRALLWTWEAVPGNESETTMAAIAPKGVTVVQTSAARAMALSRRRR